MELDFGVVLSNLVGLFLLMGVGFIAVKAKILPASSSGAMSALLLKITLPCTIFNSMAGLSFDPAFVTDLLIVVGLSLLIYLLNTLLSWLLVHVFRVADGSRGVWMFGSIFSNNGFMGFPVCYALFGDQGLALAAMTSLPFNLLVYTLGARLVCIDTRGEAQPIQWRSVLLSNINIALVLGVAFYFLQVPLPGALLTPLTHFGNVTTPLSMFVTGMALAAGKGAELFRDRDSYSACLMRLVLMPAIAWIILLVFPVVNPLIPGVLLVIMAMPAPAVTTILAETYHGNRELAAKIVFLTSLFCIITLPLFTLLL